MVLPGGSFRLVAAAFEPLLPMPCQLSPLLLEFRDRRQTGRQSGRLHGLDQLLADPGIDCFRGQALAQRETLVALLPTADVSRSSTAASIIHVHPPPATTAPHQSGQQGGAVADAPRTFGPGSIGGQPGRCSHLGWFRIVPRKCKLGSGPSTTPCSFPSHRSAVRCCVLRVAAAVGRPGDDHSGKPRHRSGCAAVAGSSLDTAATNPAFPALGRAAREWVNESDARGEIVKHHESCPVGRTRRRAIARYPAPVHPGPA